MTRLRIIFLLPCVLLIVSCSRTAKFDDQELRWIKPYQLNDTIVFRSSQLDLDTTFIDSVEISSRNNYGEVIRYRVIWYKNKLFRRSASSPMVTLIKYQDGHVVLGIDYLKASYTYSNLDSASFIKDESDSNIILINTFHEGSNGATPKMLYWRPDSGLVRYLSHDEVLWKRVK